MRQTRSGQHLRQKFGFLNRGRTHKAGLALLVRLFEDHNNLVVFLFGGAENLVMFIHTRDWTVCRNFNNAQTVDFGEFFRFGHRCTRHARQLVIETEIILERNRRQRDVLRLDRAVFFCLNRLMQPVRQTAT